LSEADPGLAQELRAGRAQELRTTSRGLVHFDLETCGDHHAAPLTLPSFEGRPPQVS
jgi:hypothetical protein